jgi:hypothetical protein
MADIEKPACSRSTSAVYRAITPAFSSASTFRQQAEADMPTCSASCWLL